MDRHALIEHDDDPRDDETARSWWRWPRRLLLLGAAVEAFYLLAANLIVSTQVLDSSIYRKPEKLLVEIDRGWTVIPGVVHVRGLHIHGQSRQVQWQCEVPAGTFHISLLPLLDKTVRLTYGHGDGFQLRLRTRLTRDAAEAGAGQHFPEIAHYSNPPDPVPEDLYPPPARPSRKSWFIDISGIRLAGPLEIWFNGVRLQGSGLIAGGYRQRMRSELSLPGLQLEVEDGVLSFNAATILDQLQVEGDIRLEPFVPRETKGRAALSYLLGDLRIADSRIPDLRDLGLLLPDVPILGVEEGSGRFKLAARQETLQSPSTAELSLAIDDARLLLDGEPIGGRIFISSRLADISLAKDTFKLDETTVSLEDMVRRGQDATKPRDPWSGSLTVDHGTIVLGQPLDIDLVAHYRVDDTRPLLHLFFAKPNKKGETAKLPKWASLVPNIKNFEGRASLDLDASGLVIDDLVAEGDKTVLMARARSGPGGLDGQLYLRHGLLRLGVGLEDGRRRLKLIRSKRWYLAQPEYDATTRQPVPEEAPPDAAPEPAG